MYAHILKTSDAAKKAWATRGKGAAPSGSGDHTSHTDAMNAAHEHVKSKGYAISDQNWQDHISGKAKPGEGKTNRYDIPLHKDGKSTDKYAHVQVYNKGSQAPKPYELNSYVDAGKPKFTAP
jgi:hypothetical protein